MNAAPLTDPDRLPAPPEPPRWNVARQAWALSSYADVQAALRLRCMTAANPRDELVRIEARTLRHHPHLTAALEGTMLFQSDPRHAASRLAMRRALAALSQSWTKAALDAEARAIVAALPDDASCDVATGLADMLPCRVAGDMLGLDTDRLRSLRDQSRQITAVWRPMPPLREYARLESLCRDAHADLECEPPSLRGVADDTLDYPLADLVLFLVIASVDSTASTIAAGLDLLAGDMTLQARLRAQPGLMDAFVGETLRLAGPLRWLHNRVTTAPTTFAGVEMPRGCSLILQVDRAHRDPTAYPDPHRLDLERRGPPLAAFGGGAHACQGAVLGQTQVAAMLTGVIERFEITSAPGRRALADNPVLHQFASLPLRLARLSVSAPTG